MSTQARRTLGAGGLLVLLLTCPVAGADEEYPDEARLKAFRPKTPFLRSYELPSDREPVAEAPCLVGRIEKVDHVFVDVDGNGRFDEAGVDGWTVKGETHLVPLERPLISGASRHWIRVDPEAKRLHVRSEGIEASADHLRALALLNKRRLQNGLVPADLDLTASLHCRLHARYMEQNGIQTHDEDPSLPGFTPEGRQAGQRLAIGGSEDLPWMAEEICRQFFHRFSALDARTRAFGLAADSGYSLIDGASVHSQRAWPYPVLIPAPGSKGQPLHFATSERPSPFEGGLSPGFPITMRFRWGSQVEVEKAILKELGRRPLPRETLVSWPGHPAHESFPHNYAAICIIPKQALTPRTRYEVHVEYRTDAGPQVRTWEFETGAR